MLNNDIVSPLEEFFAGDTHTKYGNRYRPKCVNHGCNRLVMEVHKNSTGEVRYRAYCYKCHEASWKKGSYLEPGVTPRKVGKCDNADGHYGFKCIATATDLENTEIHHRDGDHRNNDPKNIDEVCIHCHHEDHRRKGYPWYF